ncbi:hypothetical protein EFL57_00725 [Weissella confusa]|uniref:SIR2 family protein n=1 Tax=Weissella confusa TaxID=1583 RepID=UPI00223B00E3|nr:SIR2 family protein [Weissella confusa]MCT0009018.1 hypothetical protein [Weissella confusa]
MFLDDLIKENQYPIIFAGAGLTKRYYSDAPSWSDLIKNIWSETFGTETFYDRYFTLKEEYADDDFEILTRLAEELESQFNRAFFKQQISIEGLSVSDVYQTNQSPFKTKVANIFKNLTPNEEHKDELDSLKSMLMKARFIVTTNYDMLIESLLDDDIKINIGSSGLFQNSEDYGELYKIHGSVSQPDSIVITKSDYTNIEKTNTLVNAKILSKLTESPIVFIGYSLTDKNIKSLLSDLSANMPYSADAAAKRIGVVAYTVNENEIKEALNTMQYSNTTIAFTELKTDNFGLVYSKLSTIKQGLSPNEIRRYRDAIRTLILSGNNNSGQPVLVSSINLDNLPNEIADRNVAVAIASSDTIQNAFGLGIPDYVDYIRAYFLKSVADFKLPLALDFINSKQSDEIFPVTKIVELANDSDIATSYEKYEQVKAKVSQRNHRRPNLEILLSTPTYSISKDSEILFSSMRDHNQTPVQMYDSQLPLGVSNTTTALKFITKHIEEFKPQEVVAFTEYLLNTVPHDVLKKTDYRRYFLAYSFVQNPNTVELK